MKALIIGVGNIGLRHIQGLSKIDDDQKLIYLFDTNKNYRSRFEKDLIDIQNQSKIFFI